MKANFLLKCGNCEEEIILNDGEINKSDDVIKFIIGPVGDEGVEIKCAECGNEIEYENHDRT